VVFTDSHYALQAIQAGNAARTGRALLKKIAESIEALSSVEIDVRFRWSPGHEGVVGNEEANDAARRRRVKRVGLQIGTNRDELLSFSSKGSEFLL
jgi:ribonuclease HI